MADAPIRAESPGDATPVADALEERVPLGRIVTYATPLLGVMLSGSLVSLYLLKFATDVLLIAPAVVGAIFLAGRVWDAVSDPLVGHLSDRTRTRLGRRRPWFLGSALPVGIATWAVWAPPAALEGPALIAWFAAAILLFYTAFTAFRVPHLAMGAELSRGYHDRTRVFGVLQVVEGVGIIGATGALFLLERADDQRAYASELFAGVAAVTVLLVLIATATLRERPEFQGRGGATALGSLRDLLQNPHALVLMGIYLLEQLGFTALVSLLPFLSDYVLLTPGYTSYYVFGAVASMILSIPAWIVVSRRVGKKPAWLFSVAVKTLAFGAMCFLGAGDVVPVLAVCVVFGLMNGCSAVVAPSLQADVVDWDEARTGERKEGTYFATFNFAHKCAAGLSIWITGTVLTLTGFEPNAEQSERALLGIRFLVAAFPMVLYGVSLFLVARFGLDERAHRELRHRLRR